MAIFESLQINDLLQAISDTQKKIKRAIEHELTAAQEKFPELTPLRRDIDEDFETFASEVRRGTPLDSDSGNTAFNKGIGLKLVKLINLVLPEAAVFIRNPYIQAAVIPLQILLQVLLERIENQSAEAAQLYRKQWADHVAQSALRLNECIVKEVQRAVDEAFEKVENDARVRKHDLDDQAKAMARHREELLAYRKYVQRHLDYMRG